MLDVGVLIDERVGLREPAAVDDRRAVELVGEDDGAGPGESRDDADVCEVPGAEQERRLAALERGLRDLVADALRRRAVMTVSGSTAPM